MLFNPYGNQLTNMQQSVQPQMSAVSAINPVYSQQQSQQATNKLPPQQILQANGKSSVDALQMSPNSSVLIMDSTAPIVWMCISDGLGNVSSSPYDISPHIEKPPVNLDTLEQRLVTLENTLRRMEDINNAKSYDATNVSKSDNTQYSTNKKHDDHRS